MRYRVLLEQDEDGMWIVECPSLPGCISQGRTRKEALKNIEDAITGYIESLDRSLDENALPGAGALPALGFVAAEVVRDRFLCL